MHQILASGWFPHDILTGILAGLSHLAGWLV